MDFGICIPLLVLGDISKLNRSIPTPLYAGVAIVALAAPDRLTIRDLDVSSWANPGTGAAAVACIGGPEVLVDALKPFYRQAVHQ